MAASSRKFGVEIECFVPIGTSGFRAGRYHRGIQIKDCPNGWNGQSDVSIGTSTVINGMRYRAVEVVSPPMSGLDGLAQIYYVLELLESSGAVVTDKCGIHVHVDGHNMDNRINAVVQTFIQYEDVFYGLCGEKAESRKNNNYCTQSQNWPNLHGQRYHSLNVQNMYRSSRKKTFEFRLFSADLDIFYILTAVYSCVALVEHASTNNITENVSGLSLADKAESFVTTFWGKIDNLIIPNESTEDIENVLLERVIISQE